MKKSLLFLAAVLTAVSVSAKAPKQYEDSVRADGLFNTIVITGGKPTAEMLAEDNWIAPMFLPQSGKPDSELNILFPKGDVIVTSIKSTVNKLFPQILLLDVYD